MTLHLHWKPRRWVVVAADDDSVAVGAADVVVVVVAYGWGLSLWLLARWKQTTS